LNICCSRHAALTMAHLRFLLVALFSAASLASGSQCPGTNNWLNTATGETGACIRVGGPTGTWGWHCPWESAGLVSTARFGGCDPSKYQYDCADTTMVNSLVAYYTEHDGEPGSATAAIEWGNPRVQYVKQCIQNQCLNGPAPTLDPTWTRRLGETVSV